MNDPGSTGADRVARRALGWVVDAGDPEVADLVERLGATGAWDVVREGALGEKTAERAVELELERCCAAEEAAGVRFVVPGDEEWPGGLDDLAGLEPVQRRGGVPLGLWLSGPGHLA
ncbi:MAG: hypothetical protein ACRYG2_18140, partial [Janthinobacterium lividum]